MTANRDNLLETVYFIRFGVREFPKGTDEGQKFFEELRFFRQTLIKKKFSTVSVVALRGWVLGERKSIPKRDSSMAFLHGYLCWIEEAKILNLNLSVKEERERKLDLDNLLLYLKPFDQFNIEPSVQFKKSEQTQNRTLNEMIIDKELIARFWRILNSSFLNGKRSQTYDLFEGGNKRNSQDDVSYYLLYRYSTNNGNLMKSFIVIERPAAEIRSFSSFYHFSRGLIRPAVTDGKIIFRECEGIVLPFEHSFYLIGYNYKVQAAENISQSKYQENRQRARQHPDGIGLIAIEYEDVGRSSGLIGGLIMTMAGGNQPVVARIALLHIGTKSSLGVDIWDHQIIPWEGPDEKAGKELQRTLEKIKSLGCVEFGTAIAKETENILLGTAGEKLLEEIRHLIDNTPAWSTAAHNPLALNRKDSMQAQGALETYGLNRPRD